METKLSTYWISSFSKICLGMKIDQQLRFIVIHKRADSLYSLIADGQYRNTSLGRDTWRSLTGPKAPSQIYCNREGFDLYPLTAYWEFKTAKAKIGFITNNANNCNDVDTRIGFGTGGPHDDKNACGIVADESGLDNGSKFMKALGYILVQRRAKIVYIGIKNVNITTLINNNSEKLNAYLNTRYLSLQIIIHTDVTLSFMQSNIQKMYSRKVRTCILSERRYRISLLMFNSISSSSAALTPEISSWRRDLQAVMLIDC